MFDFDGTIANSLDIAFHITNRLAKEFGYPTTSLEEFKQLKKLSSREILKQAKISVFVVPFLVKRFNAEFGQSIQQLPIFPGMRETLLELKQRGDWLGIVSTNSEKNIRSFLETQRLSDVFAQVVSSSRPFGKSRLIKKIVRQHGFASDALFYVGDETRDIEAARKSGIRAIAVTWGFNSAEALAAQQPDFLIHQPPDLLALTRPASASQTGDNRHFL
ncbi:HAD hydrolase-like protein [Myxacorys almedinensis A]|uniref:HAD hydrolase-like protein n=1 Tax=Myxacorys almedinensis A TaxID=2690445 RepID=A0A8J7Z2N0_9CYAN|nr:HAD hydrolase-like protein [Myxacorys almedinensis]NDJ18175.1 HAD hydrolase-like protein [Myxacorys almedinensis A]